MSHDSQIFAEGPQHSQTGRFTVELRRCEPEALHQDRHVPGIDEFFLAGHYASGPVTAMICSPWIDGDAIATLGRCLSVGYGHASSVFILTMLAHQPDYWNRFVAPALCDLRQRSGAYVQIRVLPIPGVVNNKAGIHADALHAKLYVLASKPPGAPKPTEAELASLTRDQLLEGFFGSANFTAKGQHLGRESASHKWEFVARATDGQGRVALLEQFGVLWHRAHRIEREHPEFHSNFEWPYHHD